MSVTSDIAATYRGPSRVMQRLLSQGPREDRALVLLMTACLIVFVAQMPRLAREAHLTGQELNMLLAASLFAWLAIAPLLLYGLAFLSHLLARLLGGQGEAYGARLALFWALLASTPLICLHGLVAGLIGPGLQLQIVGAAWLAVFLLFWISALFQAERPLS